VIEFDLGGDVCWLGEGCICLLWCLF